MGFGPLSLAYLGSGIFLLSSILYIKYTVSKNTPPAIFSIIIIGIMALWNISLFVQTSTSDLSLAVLMFKLNFSGILFLGPLMLLFILTYTRGIKNDPRFYLAIAIPSIVLFVLYHIYSDMFYNHFSIYSLGGYTFLNYKRDILAYVHLIILYIYTLYGIFVAIRYYITSRQKETRKTALVLTLIILIPSLPSPVATFLEFILGTSANIYVAIEFVPLVFLISDILLIYLVAQYQLLTIVPLALETIIDELPNPIIVLNTEQRVVYLNRTAREVLGIKGEIFGLEFKKLKHNIDKRYESVIDIANEHISQVPTLKHNKRHRIEELVDISNGQIYRVIIAPLYSHKTEMVGHAISLIDESEMIRKEKEIFELYQEQQMLNDILYHDIGNILQIIQTTTELLEYRIGDHDEVRSHANKVLSSIERANHILKNLRRFMDIKSKKDMPLEDINLFWIFEKSYEVLIKEYDHKNIELRVEKLEIDTIRANALIYDAIYNVLSNAVKYDPRKDVRINVGVELYSEVQGGKRRYYAKIYVKDRGIGIPDEYKKRIFSRYQRVVSSGERKGTGLGLAITKAVVDLFNGRIVVKDRVEGDHTKGTIFEIYIPINIREV